MNVYFGENALTQLSALTYNYDNFFLLTDENIFKIYSSMIASLIPSLILFFVFYKTERWQSAYGLIVAVLLSMALVFCR